MRAFNYEAKAKIVNVGNSKVFKDWRSALPNLTEEMFLKEVKWLCENPCDQYGKLTREIGLTGHGIVRLNRYYDGWLTTIRYPDGKLWTGDYFYRPCNNKNFADENGMIRENHMISLSAADRV